MQRQIILKLAKGFRRRRFALILIALTLGIMAIAILLSLTQHTDRRRAVDLLKKTSIEHKRPALPSLDLHFNQREKGQQIFFLETSGRSCLTARQACGVESAARTNPNSTITLYMEETPIMALSISDRGYKEPNCGITIALFQQMRNIKVVRENLLLHLKMTPLWKLYRTGLFNKSTSPLVHRSDAVRVALLWKKGGVYLDLDCIVFRPLHSLNNTVGKVKDFIENWVENGVMAFQAGHSFLYYLMKSMVLAFRPEHYLSIGPEILYSSILDFCNRDDLPVNKWLSCRRNSSLIIQHPDLFYAISSPKADRFYQPDIDPADWNQLQHTSILSHIYGSTRAQTVHSESLYAKLAKRYCPLSYTMATNKKNQF